MKYFAINFLYGDNKSMWRRRGEQNPQDILITAVMDWLLFNVYALMIFRITQVPHSPHAEPTRDVINNHFSGDKSIMQVFLPWLAGV